MRTERGRRRRHAPEANGLLPFPGVTVASPIAPSGTIAAAISCAVPADIPGAAYGQAAYQRTAYGQTAYQRTVYGQTAYQKTLAEARTLVRSRRFGFYMDVLGATFFMALFVAAAILV